MRLIPPASTRALLVCVGLSTLLACGPETEPQDGEDPDGYVDEGEDEGPGPDDVPIEPPHTEFPPAPRAGQVPGSPFEFEPSTGGPVEKPAEDLSPVDPENAVLDLEELAEILRSPPTPPDPRSVPVDTPQGREIRGDFARRKQAWDDALDRSLNLGKRYFLHLGDGPADARAHLLYGCALSTAGDRRPRAEAEVLRRSAVEHLRAFLSVVGTRPEDVTQAHSHLGNVLLKLGGDSVDEAMEHLGTSVTRLQKEGRKDESAVAAFLVLQSLIAMGREESAAKAAADLGLSEGDFGPGSWRVHGLVRRAGIRPGAAFPGFPEGAADVDGAALDLASFGGRPFVVHFFQAGLPTGRPTGSRIEETVLAPIHLQWAGQGLGMVGCSLDLEMSSEELAQVKANWEEWGLPGIPHDGSRQAVLAWAREHDMTWRLQWEGKWFRGDVAERFGVTEPFAFLVDGKGVVRWRGAPPYRDLAAAVAEVMRE